MLPFEWLRCRGIQLAFCIASVTWHVSSCVTGAGRRLRFFGA